MCEIMTWCKMNLIENYSRFPADYLRITRVLPAYYPQFMNSSFMAKFCIKPLFHTKHDMILHNMILYGWTMFFLVCPQNLQMAALTVFRWLRRGSDFFQLCSFMVCFWWHQLYNKWSIRRIKIKSYFTQFVPLRWDASFVIAAFERTNQLDHFGLVMGNGLPFLADCFWLLTLGAGSKLDFDNCCLLVHLVGRCLSFGSCLICLIMLVSTLLITSARRLQGLQGFSL